MLVERLAHALEHMRVNVAGAVAKVGRHPALDLRGKDSVALPVHFLDNPAVSGDGDALTGRWRVDDRAQFGRLATNGELLVFLEYGVELKVVDDALSRETHDESAALGDLDMVDLNEVTKQYAIVIGRDAMEIAEREHALGKFGRRELAGAGEGRHGLVIEQTVGESIELGRLDPLFLAIELYERDALQELPRNGLGHHRARLGFFLAHDKPHLGRKVAASCAPHALQKGADGKRRVDLERALQAADIDTELQRRGGDGCLRLLLVAHELLGCLAQRCRKIAMVDQEAVGLVPAFTVAAQHGAHGLCLLTRVGKDQALAPAGVFEDIAHAGIGVVGRGVGGVEERLLDCLRDVDFALGGRGSAAVLGGSLAPCLLATLAALLLCELSAMTHVLGAGGQCRGCRCLDALAREYFGLLRTCALESPLLCLGARVVEVLHGDAPHAARFFKAGDNAVTPCSLREKSARALGVADGGRKADAAGLHACHAREALDKAERLPATVAAHERVDLVDDHIAQVAKHTRDRHVLMD